MGLAHLSLKTVQKAQKADVFRAHAVKARTNLNKDVSSQNAEDLLHVEHLVRLESSLREAFTRKHHLVSVFFDLEKAFDPI